MRLRTPLMSLISFLLAASTLAASPSQTLKSPEQVTHDFYQWYIRELNGDRDPIKQPQALSRYVTARLIGEINRQIRAGEYDADYFTCIQESPKDWEQKMAINAIKSTPDSPAFYVEKPPYKIKVTLQQEANVWKIDRAQCE